ncbi:MAG: nucleotidyltransferase family protein [Dehalococcoidia bacterium]
MRDIFSGVSGGGPATVDRQHPPQAPDGRAFLADLGVLVLAAGRSTRIREAAAGLPKPLIPIEGFSVLEWNLRWLQRSGVACVWINIHNRPEAIQRLIGSGQRLGLHVSYSLEQELLGTAGAYKQLESHRQGTTLIVDGDSPRSLRSATNGGNAQKRSSRCNDCPARSADKSPYR